MSRRWLVTSALIALAPLAWCQTLSDPAVDAFNCRMGFINIGPKYQFTTNQVLLEGAMVATNLGINCYKFHMGANGLVNYGITNAAITNLVLQARDEPAYRAVFDLPTMRNYVIWCYPFAGATVKDGMTSTELTNQYNEVYAFTRYLLTNYNNSGKTFNLGNWETDWGSLDIKAYDATNPAPVAVQGTIDFFNIRQKAVDDAKAATPHSNVQVYHYAEVVMVTQTLNNPPGYNQRCLNAVIPYVTNLDYVSWSAYTIKDSNNVAFWMDYVTSFIPTNKAAQIPGKRVWVGEFSWSGEFTSDQQAAKSMDFARQLYDWGCPFSFYWELYGGGQYSDRCLVEETGYRTRNYTLFANYWNAVRLRLLAFKQQNGRLPTDAEFGGIAHELLSTNVTLVTPDRLALTAGPPTSADATSIVLSGSLTQGVYGDACANVTVYWGPTDGGTNKLAWANSLSLGLNTNAGKAGYAPVISNLPPARYFYRYYASNRWAEAWSPTVLDTNDFGSRTVISFSGYQGREALENFPALICLGTNLPGFSYAQFASPVGADLRFVTAGDATLLAHEVDEWNTNGTSYVWVKLPLLAGSGQSVVALWGNAAATNPLACTTNGAVWADNFNLVWHLRETNFPYADSALNFPATSGGAPSTAAGMIGRGCSFDGSSDYLSTAVMNVGNEFTVSAWVNVKTNTVNQRAVWATKADGVASGFALFVNNYSSSDQALVFQTADGVNTWKAHTPSNAVSFGDWHLVTAALDKGAWRVDLFVDGTNLTDLESLQNGFGTQGAVNLGRLLTNSISGYYFKGLMDEVRIEPTVRSEDWIQASHRTVAANDTFASYGTVERDRPTMRGRYAGAALNLTWPASAVGFTLWSATNLSPGAVWSVVTNPPSLVISNNSTMWQVAIPIDSQPRRFYRLKSP